MANEFEGILDKGFNLRGSQLITRTMVSNEYSLYLHGPIGNADDYMEHFAVLKQATPNDIVSIYFNTPGGNMATAFEFIDHMNECQAPILGIIGLDCASAGTAIALSCDGWRVSDFSTFMVHSFSYGAYGHATAVETQGLFNSALNEKFVRKTYADFLTEAEILDVIKGVDLLIKPEDLADRLERLANKREEAEKEIEELEEIEIVETSVGNSSPKTKANTPKRKN